MNKDGQDISLIRFVDTLDYLKDDLLNGFMMSGHSVSFEATMLSNIIKMFDIWQEMGLVNETISRLKNIYKTSISKDDFLNKLVIKFEKDNRFKWNVIHLAGSVSFEVPMKSFTEVRHNQKLHRYHVGFFGKYGVQLTQDWAIKSNATPVIYVKRDSEISRRLGMIVSTFNTLGKKYTMNALFDFLSLIEVGNNSLEFEWRIVGNHELFINSKKTLKRIEFNLDDVLGLYVKEYSEIDDLKKFIMKYRNEGTLTGSIPKIYLADDILLTDNEIDEIENIKKR
ncbi:abortive infection system antitoxin AbiGi family protein [Winogradskyella sp. A3E31]|uniref:abortive infection system antitoxin AbiGi family protein n=1 Tax=Winogradskyella sp. A3E31 TaxID=3349637 RepID=UPI00398B0887